MSITCTCVFAASKRLPSFLTLSKCQPLARSKESPDPTSKLGKGGWQSEVCGTRSCPMTTSKLTFLLEPAPGATASSSKYSSLKPAPGAGACAAKCSLLACEPTNSSKSSSCRGAQVFCYISHYFPVLDLQGALLIISRLELLRLLWGLVGFWS